MNQPPSRRPPAAPSTPARLAPAAGQVLPRLPALRRSDSDEAPPAEAGGGARIGSPGLAQAGSLPSWMGEALSPSTTLSAGNSGHLGDAAAAAALASPSQLPTPPPAAAAGPAPPSPPPSPPPAVTAAVAAPSQPPPPPAAVQAAVPAPPAAVVLRRSEEFARSSPFAAVQAGGPAAGAGSGDQPVPPGAGVGAGAGEGERGPADS